MKKMLFSTLLTVMRAFMESENTELWIESVNIYCFTRCLKITFAYQAKLNILLFALNCCKHFLRARSTSMY